MSRPKKRKNAHPKESTQRPLTEEEKREWADKEVQQMREEKKRTVRYVIIVCIIGFSLLALTTFLPLNSCFGF